MSFGPRARRIALAAAMTLAGCGAPRQNAPSAPHAPSLRVDPAAIDREPSAVGPADALADLELALTVFAEAYAAPEGRSPVPPPARVDEARRQIEGRASWSPRELATLLRDLLRTDDGHLAFGHGGAAPLRLEALPSPERPRRSGPAVELTSGKVPVLAIRTFESAEGAALRELPRIAERLRSSRAFVIDLRGNHGGNYAFAERFLLSLTSAPIRALDAREVLSATAAEGRASSIRARLLRGDVPLAARGDFLAQIELLEALASDLRARPERGRREIVRRGKVLRGRAPGPLAGRGVLLVDRGCASACEMLVALARQVPGLIVAGERTRGGMAVGEVALFRLPRSGLTLTLGTRAFHDPLGDFDETRGFSPDLPLDGPDVLAEAQRAALSAPPDTWAAARARAPRLAGRNTEEFRAETTKAGSSRHIVR
ncbi:S41 family peptidase [Polyangium aurulentum]|uniref:S41 family peptidase n=1 Tax=Polyangium aurulentum TaxID=2567896 RepID=UPI00146DD8EA|nr:S41 family peptidase [Polyangium aurulentum]UQA63439.1 hypothetical protein E8A73_024385 [Polyangium aurulentum]